MSNLPARGLPRFTRKWWIGGLYTFFWVAIITILVWTYADQEFTTDRELVVTVRLTTGDSTSHELKSADAHKITVQVQGNRDAVDRLAPGEGKAALEVVYDVSKIDKLGSIRLDAEDIIDEGLGISKAHLSILSVSDKDIDFVLGQPESRNQATLLLAADESSELYLASAPSVQVDFKLEGDRTVLNKFAQALRDGQSKLAFDVSKGLGPGKHTIRTDKLLTGHESIANSGLTVRSCTPEVIDIELDKLLKQTVKVKFSRSGATLAAEEIEPAQVTILVREASWQAIKAKQADPVIETVATDLTVAKTASGVGVLKVPLGQEVELIVNLSQEIEGIAVKPQVDTVKVKLKIAALIDSGEVRVRVRVLAPPKWSEPGGVWTKRVFVRKDPSDDKWWPMIRFQGSKLALEKLKAMKMEIDAYIKLEEGDEEEVDSWLAKKVIIKLPPGLDVEMVGPIPEVKVKCEPKK